MVSIPTNFCIKVLAKPGKKLDRVGSGAHAPHLSHHRTYGSVYGGS